MLKEMICYRVEVRLKVISVEEEDEENYFEYEENISWSDGAIIIKDDKFIGFLTNDYIWGEIKANKIYLHIFDDNYQYLEFETSKDNYFIDFPNSYEMYCVLEGLEYWICNIEFKKIEKDSFLYKTYGTDKKEVNSFHHQAIKNVAQGFNVTAFSNDNTIEAIEKGNVIGVQWHPEKMNDLSFFKSFINL